MIGSTFNLAPYSSNQLLSTFSCGGLISMNPLIDGDYIARVFTGLGLNHYQCTLMFGVTVLGVATNTLTLLTPEALPLSTLISLLPGCGSGIVVTLTGCAIPTIC